LLYNDAEAGKLLKLMAPIALFIYLQSPLQAALQALDRAGTALLNTFVGAAVKLVLIFLLAAKLELGIVGAVLAINANIVLVTALHWGSVSRMLKFSMQTADLLKVGLAMLLMGGACWYVLTLPGLSGFAQFAAACMAGGAVYLCSLVWFKLIDRHDISRIPWIGGKISRWF
jgi:stage V sporulation protein B